MRVETYNIRDKHDLVRKVLGGHYEELIVSDINIQESFRENELTRVRFSLSTNKRDFPASIDVSSNGVLDGFFIGLSGALSIRFDSLRKLKLNHFDTKVATKRSTFKSDEYITATITLVNANDYHLDFKYTSRSLVRAMIHSIIDAFEFLLNLESAIRLLHKCILDAKDRNRIDIIQDCQVDLGELMQVSNPLNL